MEFGVDARLADLLGRARRARGRPPEGRGRARRAARRRRPLLPRRLLRPGRLRRGPAERALRGARPGSARARAASRSRSRSTSAGEHVTAAVWRYDVGSVPLYLLDVPWVTDALYGGDREHRIRQELLLGVGGVRALHALGIEPTVYHVNEGHSAFLDDRARAQPRRERRVDGRRARRRFARTTVFTTHTPVPAGNEVFGDDLVLRYVGDLARSAGHLATSSCSRSGGAPTRDGVRADAARPASLGARERRVGAPRRGRTRDVAAGSGPASETPIDAITNGVHLGTWLAPELAELAPGRRACARAPRPSGRTGPRRATLDPEALWAGARQR